MYVIEASFLAALAALALAMRRTLGKDALPLLPLVTYLVFSFRQSETMLLGFNISFAFVEAFGVAAIALLWVSGLSFGRRQIAAFAGALAAATVAAYSSSQGLAVWPAGLVALWLAAGYRQRKRQIALWSLVGIGEWVLYFNGYKSIPGHPSSTYALHHPLLGLKYFVSLFGASLTAEPTRALVYGLILVGLAVGALALTARGRESRRMSFWLALFAYSALIMLLITIGRSGYGVNQALSSRYSSFSILGVIALLGLLVRRARADRSRAAIGFLGATVVLIALSVPGVISDGMRSGRHESSNRKRAAYILYTYRSQPDALLRDIFPPTPALVREFAPFLEHKHYVVFAAERAPVPPSRHRLRSTSRPTRRRPAARSIRSTALRREVARSSLSTGATSSSVDGAWTPGTAGWRAESTSPSTTVTSPPTTVSLVRMSPTSSTTQTWPRGFRGCSALDENNGSPRRRRRRALDGPEALLPAEPHRRHFRVG